jgi:hypothetical protein
MVCSHTLLIIHIGDQAPGVSDNQGLTEAGLHLCERALCQRRNHLPCLITKAYLVYCGARRMAHGAIVVPISGSMKLLLESRASNRRHTCVCDGKNSLLSQGVAAR